MKRLAGSSIGDRPSIPTVEPAAIAVQAKANGGKAVLTTVQGAKLTVWKKDGSWYVSDAKGGTAKIGPPDVLQSNGVIHVIDGVLLPA